MDSDLLLIILIIIGIVGKSRVITVSACFLLVINLISMERFLPVIERRGLEIGLLFLTVGVLVPFASGRISSKDVFAIFTSVPGILALIGGAAATNMNGIGLELLVADPQLIVGLVIGSIFGIIILRGTPSGPLMAAGITAFIMEIVYYLFDQFL